MQIIQERVLLPTQRSERRVQLVDATADLTGHFGVQDETVRQRGHPLTENLKSDFDKPVSGEEIIRS